MGEAFRPSARENNDQRKKNSKQKPDDRMDELNNRFKTHRGTISNDNVPRDNNKFDGDDNGTL